jgi:hypothetical protein
MEEVEDSGGTQRRRNLWELSGIVNIYGTVLTILLPVLLIWSMSRDLVLFGLPLDLDQGSGKVFSTISDPGSLTHISESIITIFGVKILFSLSVDFILFSVPVELKSFQFCEIHGYKKGKTIFPRSSFLLLDPGSRN